MATDKLSPDPETSPSGTSDLHYQFILYDQRKKWEAGERARVESYLENDPQWRSNPKILLDLIYHEILLQEAHGEHPTLEEYSRRFPDLAEELQLHFEIHAAISSIEQAADQVSEPGKGELGTVNRPDLWPTIPGLQLEEVIGSGGMGVVFKARQLKLEREVAVKLLRDAHRGDSALRERFLQEARTIARLRHPHLVQVFEFGEVPDANGVMSQPYLVLEYVPGGTLARYQRGSPQPPAEAAQLIERLAEAMHYAHQQGVIHRDLKPSNILLASGRELFAETVAADAGGKTDSKGTAEHASALAAAKITDFGLAKLQAGSDLTHTGDVVGTPGYMAPEQAVGKSDKPIGPAVDVYGLGTILYETLTGRPPFAAPTIPATLNMVLYDAPVPPRLLQPAVPRDLETICLNCLRKEAGRRYATAQELADDIRRFRSGEPIKARPVGSGERVIIWCRRYPGLAGLLAALVLVVLVGTSGIFWQWQKARRNAADYLRERDIALQEKERARHHLQIIRERVDGLKKLGLDLLRQPRGYATGEALLKESLAFYQGLLPTDGNDPALRREAADLYGEVASIHFAIGQLRQADSAFEQRAKLLTSLLEDAPGDKSLRLELADAYRWRGNTLRDLGETAGAREYYQLSKQLHEELLADFPGDAHYRMALANTLLNMVNVVTQGGQIEERLPIFQRAIQLLQSALEIDPNDLLLQTELALGLETEGQYFQATGRLAQAEEAIRQALVVHDRLISGGRLKGTVERYKARSLACLARVLAAGNRTTEGEETFQSAVKILERSVEEAPTMGARRAELAQTLVGLANFFKESGRKDKFEEVRLQAVSQFEKLREDYPENPTYRLGLVRGYLDLSELLSELGRQGEADEYFRKALTVKPDNSEINNSLAWFQLKMPESPFRDTAMCVRLAKKAVAARPQNGGYHNTLGVALYRSGDDRAAIAELEVAMRLRNGGDSFDWFFLAMAYDRLGEVDKARTWFDRAAQWMDANSPRNVELQRFRVEANAMLTGPGKR